MDVFGADIDGFGGDALGGDFGGDLSGDFGGELGGGEAGGGFAAGPDAVCGLEGAAALAGGDAGTGMVIGIGGELFDLGPGTADTDSDGVADSVTLADDRGLSIFTDADGDGTVDHVTTVLFDGTWETWSADGEVPPARAEVCLPGDSGPEIADDASVPFGGDLMGVDDPRHGVPAAPATWDATAWELREHGRWT